MTTVIWHDLECHGYAADLELWQELARSPVLDVGAGTGRVALDLAASGHAVTALDADPELLAMLRTRAAARGLEVATVCADAQSFALRERFATILVPMQTVQLFADRAAFLAAAVAHLRPGGVLALAIAEDLDIYDGDLARLPDPDVHERDGWRFVSQPLAIRLRDATVRIERRRTARAPDGTVTEEAAAIELARISAGELEAEGRAAGLHVQPRRAVAATDEHVGSTVVVLRA